jgi:two-component system, NarL family, sensor histidine kinase UhpB
MTFISLKKMTYLIPIQRKYPRLQNLIKKLLIQLILILHLSISFAFAINVDSLDLALKNSTGYEKKVELLKRLSDQKNGSSIIIQYALQGIALARQMNRPYDEEYFLSDLCRGYNKNDDYPKMLETALSGLQISQQLKDEDRFCEYCVVILVSYDQGKEYRNASLYGLKGLEIAEKINNSLRIAQLCDYMAWHFMATGYLDSALIYMRKSNGVAAASKNPNIGFSFYGLGVIHEKLGQSDSALFFYSKAVPAFKGSEIFRNSNLVNAYAGIAGIYKQKHLMDSAFSYANKAYQESIEANQFQSTYKAAGLLASLYDGLDDKKSLSYYKIASAAKDSIITVEKTKQMLMLSENERQRQNKLIDSLEKRRSQLLWALAVLSAGFLLVIFYRRYENKKRLEIEKIRSNIAADFHDELGSTLSSIALYSEIAGKDDLSNVLKTKNILSRISESSQGTISAMQDMIWSIQPRRDSLGDVIQRMRDYANPLAELKNMNLQFKVDEEVLQMIISMESRKNIYLIFKEALNNAFKYALASSILVRVSRNNQDIRLEIRDNGKGFDQESIIKGNGLRNMRNRAAQLGGTLHIQSSQDGTSVHFTGRLR